MPPSCLFETSAPLNSLISSLSLSNCWCSALPTPPPHACILPAQEGKQGQAPHLSHGGLFDATVPTGVAFTCMPLPTSDSLAFNFAIKQAYESLSLSSLSVQEDVLPGCRAGN